MAERLPGSRISCPAALAALIAFMSVCLLALAAPSMAADDLLAPQAAFRFDAREEPATVVVRFRIAPGYYMYRERFAFAARDGKATLGEAAYPAGHLKYDDTFGRNVETYRDDVTVRVPVRRADGSFDLVVTSQGCADVGVCYPPMQSVMHVDGVALGGVPPGPGHGANAPGLAAGMYSQDYARSVLENRRLPAILAIFFALGMALSLLPCSWPMIPIVSAIVLGGAMPASRLRALALSAAYVLGMALVYTGFGVAAGLLGQSLGAWLQNPWALGAFAALLTVFALSLLGFYEIQLPQRWRDGAGADALGPRRGGRGAAAFAMGAVSALVVGACMTAPLFGVLTFVAQTGNAWFGGAALFAMAWGLGFPLLVVGLGAGTLLPRAGAWMENVKRIMGVLLIAVAWWMVLPVLAPVSALLLAAFWLLAAATVLGLFTPLAGAPTPARILGKSAGALSALLALACVAGAAAGATDPLRPLAVFAARGAGTTGATGATGAAAASSKSGRASPEAVAGVAVQGSGALADGATFGSIKSVADLDRVLAASDKPVMLDFYADWCVSCREMERDTYLDPGVRARLGAFRLLRADVTANDAEDRALMKRFGLFGPPSVLFFDAAGRELVRQRVVGYQDAATFGRTLAMTAGIAVR
jgi:thiol:disulfide interchange protein DsbD